MKKFIKNNIVGFILGAVIFSCISVAAYSIFANDIGYTPKDSTWKKSNGEDITNVKDAIDELYNRANRSIQFKNLVYDRYSGNKNNASLSKNVGKGKYLVYVEYDLGYISSSSVSNYADSNRLNVNCSSSNCDINKVYEKINNQSSTNPVFSSWYSTIYTINSLSIVDIKNENDIISFSINDGFVSDNAMVLNMHIFEID